MMITKWRYFDDDGIPTFYNSGIETNADNVVDALNAIENQFADLQVHIDALRAQLASRDALIERLIEAVQRVDTELNDNWICEGDEPLIFMLMKVQDIVAEYRASKDGGGM